MPTVIQQDTTTVVILNPSVVAQINANTSVTIGGQGVQGPPGPSGSGTSDLITLAAGAPVVAFRAVCAANNRVYLADPTTDIGDRELLGVAINSANANENVQIRVGGQISDISLNFTNGPVYVGVNGALVQAVPDPSTGFAWIAEIGVAVSTNSFTVEPEFIAEF